MIEFHFSCGSNYLALIHTGIGLIAVQRDAAERIAADKSFHRDLLRNDRRIGVGSSRLAMRLAVVIVVLRICGDGQRRFRDLKVSVYYRERNIEVRIGVYGNIFCGAAHNGSSPEIHLISADIRSGSGRCYLYIRKRSNDLYAACIIQFIGTLNRVAFHCLNFAVVGLCRLGASDGHGDLSLRDRQFDRIADDPGYFIVPVVIAAGGFRKCRLIGSDIGSLCRPAAGIAELAGVKARITAGGGHSTFIDLLLTIIYLARAGAVDRDVQRRRGDLKVSVDHNNGYIIVFRCISANDEVLFSQIHRIAACRICRSGAGALTDVGARRYSCFALSKSNRDTRGQCAALKVRCDREAFHALHAAVINLALLLARDGNGQFALRHREGADLFADLIVGGLRGPPCYLIGIVAASDSCLGSGRSNGRRLAVDKAAQARLFTGQRRAVIVLLRAAGAYRQRGGQDLQASGTYIQAHTVVGIIRNISKGYREVPSIVSRIFLCESVISQAGGVCIVRCFCSDCIPDVIEVFGFVAGVADQDIGLNALAAVGEAGFIFRPVIDVADPAVRLNTDGDVDLRHFQRAADVTDRVVVAACAANIRL